MTPQAQPKTNEISADLWPIFINGESLNQFSRHRFSHEIDNLKGVDPDGFYILSALLAAIDGNIKETLDLANIALQHCNRVPLLLNWSKIMVNLGQIRESFLFAKKSQSLAPGDIDANSLLISLAAAVEDTETLELALETWHGLQPGQIHPLAAVYLLNEKDIPQGTMDDENILRVLDSLQLKFIEANSIVRVETLVRKLMQEIDT